MDAKSFSSSLEAEAVGSDSIFSPMCFFSAALGLLSWGMFYQPMMLALALAALILGAIGLLNARKWTLGTVSQWLGGIGVASAVFFTSWYLLETRLKNDYYISEGRKFVDEYFKIVQNNDMEKAYLLTQNIQMVEMDRDPQAMKSGDDRTTFGQNPILKLIRDPKFAEKLQFDGLRGSSRMGSETKFILAYREGRNSNPRIIRANVVRMNLSRDGDKKYGWRLMSLDFET